MIFGCVGSSFLCEGFLQLWQAGATLHRDARASLVAEHRLPTRRLSSCGSRAQPLCGMWDLPRPELEPVSPALAGRFSTTAPPGKPPLSTFFDCLTFIYPLRLSSDIPFTRRLLVTLRLGYIFTLCISLPKSYHHFTLLFLCSQRAGNICHA